MTDELAISAELGELFDLAINECVKARRNHAMHPFLVLQEPPGGEIIVLDAASTDEAMANAHATIRAAASTVRAYAIAYDGTIHYDTGEPIPAFIVELAERGAADGFVMFHYYQWFEGELDLVEHPSRVLRRTPSWFR